MFNCQSNGQGFDFWEGWFDACHLYLESPRSYPYSETAKKAPSEVVPYGVLGRSLRSQKASEPDEEQFVGVATCWEREGA